MRIIIIEDEGITRQWLNKKIEELGEDYHVVGIFSNGSQALTYLESGAKVDVVFTDIKMPVMDGLEFLEKLMETGQEPYKIILSSYDEFQYARRAMKLGANEFILKPEITKDSLKQLLNDAGNMLKNRQPKEKPEKEKNMEEKNGILFFDLLEKKDGKAENLSEIFHINPPKDSLSQLVITSFYMEKRILKEDLEELLQLFLEQEQIKGVYFFKENQEFVLGYLHQKTEGRLEIVDKLVNILQIHLGTKIYAGISRMQEDGNIREMYRQAIVARENRIFFEIPGCQQYDAMRIEENQEDGKFYYSKDMEIITEYLNRENYAEAAERIQSFLNSIREAPHLHPAYVKALCNEILSAFLHEVWKYPLTEEEKSRIMDINLFLGEVTLHVSQLTSTMSEEIAYLNEFIQKKKSIVQYSAPIKEVMAYVENHFSEHISLEQAADAVYLSRPYLSTLFKKETGKKFSTYLQEVRLDKSCSMLKENRIPIGEVAEKTGFFDAAHFSRAFKERYGCSPIEYRKSKS